MSKIALLSSFVTNVQLSNKQQAKYDILKKYQKESSIQKIIEIAYNPWLNFGMQEFEPKHMGKKFGMGLPRFMHIIEDIISKKFDKKEAEFACRMAFMHMNDMDAPVFLLILNQTMAETLGLEISTINKVWPGLITSYPIRCATVGTVDNYDKFPAAVQPVSRGLRVNIIVNDEKVSYRLKSGEEIENFTIHNDDFIKLSQGQNTMYDGHAVVIDEKNNVVSTENQEVLDSDPSNVRFMLWDAVRYDGFVLGKDSRIGYNWRYNGIEHMMMLALDKVENPCYDLVRAELVGSQEQLDSTVSKHKQGCVIKCLEGTWSQGQTEDEIIYFHQP